MRLLLAAPMLGVASSLSIIPSLPNMQRGLDAADEQLAASVCAAWNGVYALGSAAGPLVMTALYSRFGWGAVLSAMLGASVAGATALLAGGRLARPRGGDAVARP